MKWGYIMHTEIFPYSLHLILERMFLTPDSLFIDFSTYCLYQLQYLCVSWITIISYICAFKFNLVFTPVWSWSLWGVPWREKYREAASAVKWLEAMLQFSVLQFSLAEIVSCLTSIEPTLGENAELELNQ